MKTGREKYLGIFKGMSSKYSIMLAISLRDMKGMIFLF